MWFAENDFHHLCAPKRHPNTSKSNGGSSFYHALSIKNAVKSKYVKLLGLALIVPHFRRKNMLNRHLGNPLLPSPRLRSICFITGPHSPGGAGVWGKV
jgi:hypothetical protein